MIRLTELPTDKNRTEVVNMLSNPENGLGMLADKYIPLISSKGVTSSIARNYAKDVKNINENAYVVYEVTNVDGSTSIKVDSMQKKLDDLKKAEEDVSNAQQSEEELAAAKERRAQAYASAMEAVNAATDGAKKAVGDVLSGDNERLVDAILRTFGTAANLFGKGAVTAFAALNEKRMGKNGADKKLQSVDISDETPVTEDEVKEVEESISESYKDKAQEDLDNMSEVEVDDYDKAYQIGEARARAIFGSEYDPKKFDGMFNGLKDKSSSPKQLIGMITNALKGFGPRK